MSNLEKLLTQRLAEAFRHVAGTMVDPLVHRSRRADYQADGALALGRQLGRSPGDIASEVLSQAHLSDMCVVAESASPGFINLTMADDFLDEQVTLIVADERLGVALSPQPAVVAVDYSGPNAAKEMHVGHLRSTVLGDSIVRLLEWRGHRVIRQNHLGDWATPFGMLIEHLLDMGEAQAARDLSVGDLSGFYQAARRKFDADESFAERSRNRVVLLQAGDQQTLRLWQALVEQSTRYFLEVYARLGVRLTKSDFAGESTYNDQLSAVVAELDQRGLLQESDGALCAFPSGFTNRDGDRLPLIVQKADGGFGYDTTDLAAIRYRTQEMLATRLVYVVGQPQTLHFQMIFEAAREAGWVTPQVRTEHVGFGSVLGADGKMLRTRAGASIRLVDLLDEAILRATTAVTTKNPDIPAAEAALVAQAVGIGAVKYSDLSTDRTKNYTFDYDRMLSFDGNTAPYLQYAYARLCSILRKSPTTIDDDTGPIRVGTPSERRLVLELLAFEGVIDQVEETLEPHRLCGYLYSLANAFTGFYENCPVLKSHGDLRSSRLALCGVTARTLALGLDLLGIAAPDRM